MCGCRPIHCLIAESELRAGGLKVAVINTYSNDSKTNRCFGKGTPTMRIRTCLRFARRVLCTVMAMRNAAPFAARVDAVLVGILVFGTQALAADGLAGAPSPSANCIVTAQNRSAPLGPDGNYILSNLPGVGLIPFGVGGAAQPFRVRATCDDGSAGETAMALPTLDQTVVEPGPIVWGLGTKIPASVELTLPAAKISATTEMQSLVTAKYADGSISDATQRPTGTGYRASAPGVIAIGENGRISIQPAAVRDTVAGVLGLPRLVTISAENDGVVSSRMLTVTSGMSLRVNVKSQTGSGSARDGLHKTQSAVLDAGLSNAVKPVTPLRAMPARISATAGH